MPRRRVIALQICQGAGVSRITLHTVVQGVIVRRTRVNGIAVVEWIAARASLDILQNPRAEQEVPRQIFQVSGSPQNA